MNALSSRSAWPQARIDEFLSGQKIPIRLSVLDKGFPFICSLWYVYDPDRRCIYCVSHRASKVVQLIKKDDRCAFEVSPNDPPYLGVRGKAIARLIENGAGEMLEQAISRYLGRSNQSLAEWLLGRADEEYVIEISPVWLTAWDFSNRMEPTTGD